MLNDETVGGEWWALILLALAFSDTSDGARRRRAEIVERSLQKERERDAFRYYSRDCRSLDEHLDGNAYERLCSDPRHPYHGDSRPQCDRDLCPHLHPQGHPFRGCNACR